MKNKLRKVLLVIALVFSCMINANAETIKEDTNTYTGDVYIIGSSKFDNNVIVTGTMAAVAGGREAYIQYFLLNNYEYDPADLRIYYYSELDGTWSELPVTSEDKFRELTEQEVEELTNNLNVYYVNEKEKMIEIDYDITLEEGYSVVINSYDSNSDAITYKDGKINVPATTIGFEIIITNGDEERVLDVFYNNGKEFENIKRTVTTAEELKNAVDEGILYITLGASIDLPTALEISSKVVVDLNGYNLTVKNDTAGDGVFHVVEGGDLTINGTGIVDGVGKNNYNMAIFAEGGKVTINGGTYTNVNTYINPLDSDNNHYDLIYAKNDAEVIINGGTFEGVTPRWLLNIKNGHAATISVYGGTFKGFNPANADTQDKDTSHVNYVADGYKVVKNENAYTVSKLTDGDVAMVNGMAFTTLNDAYASATNNDTIVLVNDIDLATALTVSKKVTVDLNGHNLTVKNDTAGDGVFHVVEGGDLTIDGEGIVDGVGKNNYNIAVFAEGGKVTINGGTYTNVNTVKNEEDTDSEHYDLIYAKNNAEVIINGGTFEGITPRWLLNIKNGHAATITVYGGTFKGFNPANADTQDKDTSHVNYVADGYKVVENENVYTVSKITQNDTTINVYSNLVGAYNAAPAGATLVLMNDITLEEVLVVTKTVTIDLNGHTIANEKDLWSETTKSWSLISVRENGNLTMNGNGTLSAKANDCYAIDVQNGGKVTVNNGTYIGNISALYVHEGEAVINGGTYSIQQLSEYNDYRYNLNCYDANYKNETAKITVLGGTFENYNPANNLAEGNKTNFVAKGYKVVKANDTYTVTSLTNEDVAMVNGMAFTTLNDAYESATNNDTIVLVNDIDLSTALTVSKKVTVDLNGHNLTVKNDTAGDGVFHVVEGGDLTINGEGIVDGVGKNNYNIAVFAEGGKVTINGGTYTNVNTVKNEEDTDSEHYDLIYAKNDAEVIINGGTFEGITPRWLLNIKNGHAATITVYGGTFKGFNPADADTQDENLSHVNYVADGYKVVENENVYTVVKDN